MKKKHKTIIITVIFSILISLSTRTMATGTMDDVIDGGDSFLKAYDTYKEQEAYKEEKRRQEQEEKGETYIPSFQNELAVDEGVLKNTTLELYNILLYLGIAASVIFGAIIGIKIMISSADEKAKAKEALIPYTVGCFVIFGAYAFWRIAIIIFSAWDG